MKTKIFHEDQCEVTCTDNDRMVIAEVHQFKIEDYLTVVIEKSAKINMRYNRRHKIYIGNLGVMEFTSPGPLTHVINKGR